MKVIVKDKYSEDYNKQFSVRRINYDKVLVLYPNTEGIKEFYNKDVEILTENKIDEFLFSNKELLKIRLQRGISVFLYKALLDGIEIECKEKLDELIILLDTYSINKRNVWEKNLLMLVNNKFPIKVEAIGKKFSRKDYSLKISTIEKAEFKELCNREISKIKKEVDERENLISKYTLAMENLENPGVLKNKPNNKKEFKLLE